MGAQLKDKFNQLGDYVATGFGLDHIPEAKRSPIGTAMLVGATVSTLMGIKAGIAFAEHPADIFEAAIAIADTGLAVASLAGHYSLSRLPTRSEQ